MMYSYFYVSDYKGGELHGHTNLSEKDYIYALLEDEVYDWLYELKSKPSEKDILNWLNDYEGIWWNHTYAYDWRGGLRVYQHINNQLVLCDPKDFSEDTFVEFVQEMWENDFTDNCSSEI